MALVRQHEQETEMEEQVEGRVQLQYESDRARLSMAVMA